MALINVAAREIHCKVVYYGPGMCGKTSNLQYIHSRMSPDNTGKLLSIETDTERTLFFDFLPVGLGTVRGFKTRFHLYTVPGQVLYKQTRVAVLNGADGVVFVADSQLEKMGDNLKSLKELAENIKSQRKKFSKFPIILQYNKRDIEPKYVDQTGPDGQTVRRQVSGALPVKTLDKFLNPPTQDAELTWQRFESVAMSGKGVFETLRAISKLVISKL